MTGNAAEEGARWWNTYADVPCRISLELRVPGFTVKHLLQLAPGRVIATGSPQTSDVPLRVNGELLAWSEFEMVDNRYGVRITELA